MDKKIKNSKPKFNVVNFWKRSLMKLEENFQKEHSITYYIVDNNSIISYNKENRR